MALKGRIKKLKDAFGNYLFPVTTSKAVILEDGETKLSDKLKSVDEWEAFKNSGGTIGNILKFSDDTTYIKKVIMN